MRHCCQFKADDIYYVKETEVLVKRELSVGFCPVCGKPVVELTEQNFAGGINKVYAAGMQAQMLVMELKNDIIYSAKRLNFKKFKSKPYGWRYGVNCEQKTGKIKQYAYDFYGNKELVKSFDKNKNL